jgi:hypothetical protein
MMVFYSYNLFNLKKYFIISPRFYCLEVSPDKINLIGIPLSAKLIEGRKN